MGLSPLEEGRIKKVSSPRTGQQKLKSTAYVEIQKWGGYVFFLKYTQTWGNW